MNYDGRLKIKLEEITACHLCYKFACIVLRFFATGAMQLSIGSWLNSLLTVVIRRLSPTIVYRGTSHQRIPFRIHCNHAKSGSKNMIRMQKISTRRPISKRSSYSYDEMGRKGGCDKFNSQGAIKSFKNEYGSTPTSVCVDASETVTTCFLRIFIFNISFSF